MALVDFVWNHPAMFLSDWAVTRLIKPSETAIFLFGQVVALEGKIAAIGAVKEKVFVYNITTDPAQELAIITSPDSDGSDRFAFDAVAVNNEYGVLVGAREYNGGTETRIRLYFLY